PNFVLQAASTQPPHFSSSRMSDPGRWDVQESGCPINQYCGSKMATGFALPETMHEHSSCLYDAINPGRSAHAIADDLSIKSTRFTKRIVEATDRRSAKTPLQLRGLWAEHEKEYFRMTGKSTKAKIASLAPLLCRACEFGLTADIIKRQSTIIWLFERNLINRSEFCKIFLHVVLTSIKSMSEDTAKKTLLEVTTYLCSWNVVFSHQAKSIAAAYGYDWFELTEKKEVENIADCPLTVLDLASISREYDLICLLDNEQLHREHDLDELVEKMEAIDRPKAQLPLLLNWALHHRSSMGCTLAARIIKRWSLPSTRTSLLIFIISARRPASVEDRARRRSSGGMRRETPETRFLRLLSRLFVAFAHEGLVTYDDLHEAYTRDREYFDGRSEGFSLSDLLSTLPIVNRPRLRMPISAEEGSQRSELGKRTVALLNRFFCSSVQLWYEPESGEDDIEAKEVVEGVRCLSCRDAYEMVTKACNAILGTWRDAAIERRLEHRVLVPSRTSLLLLCQLMEQTVDSSLLPRLLVQCLPYLLKLGRLTPQLAVYSSTVALFLTARCFQSHLSLNVMGIWPVMKERMAKLVQSLCPMHWQTRRLANLFETELPKDICEMSHGCAYSDLSSVESEVKDTLERLIQTEEWTDMKLVTVADLVGDMTTQLDAQSIREWWRQLLVREIKSGARSAPMLRLLSLTVYRGVLDATDMMERIVEGMRAEDISVVDCSLAMLNALLVGGCDRTEEELLMEGSIGAEIMGTVIREIVRMSSQHSSSSIRGRCSTMLSRLMKRQYPKRVVREEMDKEWLRGGMREEGLLEAYRQLVRKCSPTGWNGLDLEEGGRGLRGVGICDADAARRELQWILVKEHSSSSFTSSSMIDKLVASIFDALRGRISSSCLVHLLLTELRWEMMEDPERPPVYSEIYCNFASSVISGFIKMMKEPKRLPSSSSLLIPTVLFAWIDGDEKIKDQLRNEIHRFLIEYKGGEMNDLLIIIRLAVSLSEEQSSEWIQPFYELIRRGLITPDRNGALFAQMLQVMERIEMGEEVKEGKNGEDSEVERMFLGGRSVEEILRFLNPIQQFEK
ncbi:hypothetical protein PENTCL1PPCAC_30603, partial [Pristionchus entomophagus]